MLHSKDLLVPIIMPEMTTVSNQIKLLVTRAENNSFMIRECLGLFRDHDEFIQLIHGHLVGPPGHEHGLWTTTYKELW